jgi:hypothetical protein
MAYIPDQSVTGRVEDVVQGHGQFDDAKTGSEVTTGHRNSTDRLGSQFIGHLSELTIIQVPKIGGRFDGVEERGRCGHDRNMIFPSSRRRGAGRGIGRDYGTMQIGSVLHNSSNRRFAASGPQIVLNVLNSGMVRPVQ